MMDAALHRHAEEAIARLQEALDRGSDLRHDQMHHAIGHVFAFRNRVLRGYRENRLPRDLLDRANAVTSLAYGTEFPLAGLHAHRIRQTCAALRDLVEAAKPEAGTPAGPHVGSRAGGNSEPGN